MQNTRLVYAVVDGVPIKGSYWVDEDGAVTVTCEKGDATACPIATSPDEVAHTLLIGLVSGTLEKQTEVADRTN